MNFEHRSRREFMHFLGVCALPAGASLPFASTEGNDEDTPLPGDGPLRKQWQAFRPDIALIGNSMLYCRVDIGRLAALWQPRRTMTLALGGSRSLQWLLWLKNYVAACSPAPRLAIVLYRDFDFSRIDYHIEGKHLEAIRRAMRPGDEIYLSMARGHGKRSGIRADLKRLFTALQRNAKLQRKLSEAAYDTAAQFGPHGDDAIQSHMEEIFDMDRLRSDAVDEGAQVNDNPDEAMRRFSAEPRRNYLGDFVEVADASAIKLVFYRVKRRPNDSNVTEQDEVLRAYTAALKHWAESAGHIHIDETDDPRITLSMFRDGDHLQKASYAAYTDLFAERLRHLLPPAPAEGGGG